MKLKISISMDEDTIKHVESQIKSGIFRNKSHFIELATMKYLKEVSDEN
jgi:Arc/MetJ-type ribon-helix-helix transcriptional regulator